MYVFFISGNCAYLNEYGGNIDARRCSSSAELACPKTLYRSDETIKCKQFFRVFFTSSIFQIAMEVQNVDLDILVTNTVSYKIIINQFQFFFFNNEE